MEDTPKVGKGPHPKTVLSQLEDECEKLFYSYMFFIQHYVRDLDHPNGYDFNYHVTIPKESGSYSAKVTLKWVPGYSKFKKDD